MELNAMFINCIKSYVSHFVNILLNTYCFKFYCAKFCSIRVGHVTLFFQSEHCGIEI